MISSKLATVATHQKMKKMKLYPTVLQSHALRRGGHGQVDNIKFQTFWRLVLFTNNNNNNNNSSSSLFLIHDDFNQNMLIMSNSSVMFFVHDKYSLLYLYLLEANPCKLILMYILLHSPLLKQNNRISTKNHGNVTKKYFTTYRVIFWSWPYLTVIISHWFPTITKSKIFILLL